MSIERTIALIEAQQASFEESSVQYFTAEVLKDVCQKDNMAADIIAQDLSVDDMNLKHAALSLIEYAKKNKKDGGFGMSNSLAEKILRQFYKIPESGQSTPKPKNAPINLLDFLD